MNRTNKILIGLLAGQLALAVVLRRGDDAPGIPPLVTVVAKLTAADVTKVALFDKHQRTDAAPTGPTIELTKGDAGWLLSSAYGYPVDGKKVDDFVTKLGSLQARGAVATGEARARQLAVADDQWERKIVLTTAAGERTFFVGGSAGTRRNAFRIAGSNDIFATDLGAGGVNVSPTGWIDTAYTTVPTDDVEKVTLTRAGTTIVLDRATGSWVANENGVAVVPVAGDVLATDVMDRVVGQLRTVTVASPGDPNRAPAADATTVTLTFKAPVAPDAAGSASGSGSGSAAVSSVITPTAPRPADRVFTISLQDDKYWVREQGNPLAALVNKGALEVIASLDKTRLTKKAPDPAAAPAAGAGLERPAGMPDDMPMPFDLPPGMAPPQ